MSLKGSTNLVVKSGAKFYTVDEDGTLLDTTTYAPFNADAHVNFENGVGSILYGYNGSQVPVKIDTSSYSYSAGVSSNPSGVASFTPKFAVVFNGSMWASGNSTSPGVVYKSVGNNYEDFGGT